MKDALTQKALNTEDHAPKRGRDPREQVFRILDRKTEDQVDTITRDDLFKHLRLGTDTSARPWPMMSGACQPSPWLKPYKIANIRRYAVACAGSSKFVAAH